jgi:restriction system protein
VRSVFREITYVSPADYEKAVKHMLDCQADRPGSYESKLLETVPGSDGEYVIDVTARFTALGVDFLILVECKCLKRKVARADLQVLLQKIQSTGAQKGLVFSTAGFQIGALEFAKAHGIATIQFTDGAATYFTKSVGSDAAPARPPSWVNLPDYVGIWIRDNHYTVISVDRPDSVRAAIHG